MALSEELQTPRIPSGKVGKTPANDERWTTGLEPATSRTTTERGWEMGDSVGMAQRFVERRKPLAQARSWNADRSMGMARVSHKSNPFS